MVSQERLASEAVAFAMAVVHPAAGNLSGGGFLLSRPAEGQAAFVDFRETAPAAAHPQGAADTRRWADSGDAEQ